MKRNWTMTVQQNEYSERVPYRLAMIIGGSESFSLVIAKPHAAGYHLECSFPFGLSEDMALFIYEHGRCASCHAPISKELTACNCGAPTPLKMHLEVEFPIEIYYPIFRPILDRENSRAKKLRRKQRVEVNGGMHTQSDIAVLYKLQEGLCYFCGEPFAENAEAPVYHVDHYVPICKTGKNDPSNLVLTCPACNLRKGAMDGDSFKRIAEKIRPDIRQKLRQIRSKVNAYRATYNVGGHDLDT